MTRKIAGPKAGGSRPTAAEAYIRHSQVVDRRLQLLKAYLNGHAKRFVAEGQRDWGYVGDVERIAELLRQCFPPEAEEQYEGDVKVLVDHLHGGGRYMGRLTDEQMWEVYCLGDGFGQRTPTELRCINGGWDWSHVRDSTPEAMHRMADRVRELTRRFNN